MSKYNEELFNDILIEIASTSKGLFKICEEKGLNVRSFYRWIKEDEEKSHRYARARDEQADLLADQIISIADDRTGDLVDSEFGQQGNAANVQRSKLQVEARKWIAAKLKPKKYGDKVEVEQNVNVNKLPDWLTQPIVDSNSHKTE